MRARYFLVLAGLVWCAGCDDDAQVPDDTGVVADTGVVPDAGDGGGTVGDTGTTEGPVADDVGPDGPKVPAHWDTVQDPPPKGYDHTVTLLKNGDVLVAGGNEDDGANDNFKDTTFRFEVATEKFVDAGKMTTPRAQHTATLLNDGRVLFTGGRNDANYLESAEVFDPTKPPAQAWSAVPAMYKHRWDHTATRLNNGEVLIAGGFFSYDSSDTIVIFDPVNNSWKVPSATFNEARRGHTATLLPSGKVLFTGGVQGSSGAMSNTYLDSIEIYDPASGTMTLSKVVMSKQRSGHTATLLTSGKVLIVGGVCLNKCKSGAKQVDDIYDPATDTIATVAHPSAYLPSAHLAVGLTDGRVLVTADSNGDGTCSPTVAYDPKGGGFWSTLPQNPVCAWYQKGVRLNDGSVLVVGGIVDTNPYTLVDKATRFYP